MLLKYIFFGKEGGKAGAEILPKTDFLVSENDLHIEWQTWSNSSSVSSFWLPLLFQIYWLSAEMYRI